MRIGIFGDIHGNIDALRAIIGSLQDCGAERLYCTGDVVGYGAAPGECIDLLRDLRIPCAQGNHDQAVSATGAVDQQMRPEAREAILWTRKQLSKAQLRWLAALPARIDEDGFTVVHASHVPVPEWAYILNERSAIGNLLFQRCPLAFNGHSHVPIYLAHRPGERVRLDLLRNILLPNGHRFMIGVGSVGQPRDGDPRAAGVVYDTVVRSVRLLRGTYDVAAAQRRIRQARLPDDLADRLAQGH